MTNEFQHKTVGDELSQAEWEAIGAHVFDSQSTGDILYASSATQLSRLGIGSTNNLLTIASGIPAWTATPTITSLTVGAITASGAVTSSNTTAGFVVSGAATDGISITGACTDGIHISGNCTYPIHMTGTIDSGVGIYASHSQANACYSGIWYEIASTDTDGDFSVMRGIGTSNSVSGGNQIRVIRGQAKCGASKHADLLEGGSFEVDYSAGSCDVLRVCALAAHISQGADLNNCGNLYVAHLRAQTRGDESISTDDCIMNLENEAVGGNGRQMDSFIKFTPTSMGGGTKAAAYLLDGGTGMSLLASAVLRVPDDATTAYADGGSTADGWIKVVIGSQATYIPTYNTAH